MIPTAGTNFLPPLPVRLGTRLWGLGFYKQAQWTDVMNKSKRLIQSGKVTILLNRPHHVMAHVVGDHGEYDLEITRTDPNSQVIEQWTCECPWDQFAFDRTRKWKKLEGRPCSHVLAAYWRAKSVPLDIEDMHDEYVAPRGQRVRPYSEDETFEMNKGQLPGLDEAQADQGELDALPRTFSPDDETTPSWQTVPEMRQQVMDQSAGQPPQAPQAQPQQPQNPFAPKRPRSPKKPGPDHLQLFDITAPPGGQPVPPQNPVSIPGANPPGWQNPTNPTQFPGTFSHVLSMGMNGDLPEGMQITIEDKSDVVGNHTNISYYAMLNGQQIGQLRVVNQYLPSFGPKKRILGENTKVHYVRVEPEYQRMGIASALMERARQDFPDLQHSETRTDDGRAWADHVGVVARITTSETQQCKHCGTPTNLSLNFGDDQGEIPVCPKHEIYEAGIRREQSGERPTYTRSLIAAFEHFPPILTLARSEFVYAAADDIETWYTEMKATHQKPVFQLRNTVALEARGGKIPVPGAQPIGTSRDGLPQYRMLDLGWDPNAGERIPANHPGYPNGAPEHQGQYADVVAGRRGEVTDIEGLLKMVHVQIPINDSGPLHPHFLEGWVNFSDILPLTGAGTPFRKRR